MRTHRVASLCLAGVLSSVAIAGPYLPDPDELGRFVKIDEQSWDLGGFDDVLLVKVKLTNSARFQLKDFVIGCIAVAPSGTVLGTPRTTLYQSLRPGQSKVFAGVSVGLVNSQTKRVGCRVISASRDE